MQCLIHSPSPVTPEAYTQCRDMFSLKAKTDDCPGLENFTGDEA
jgi:hypothetical protein